MHAYSDKHILANDLKVKSIELNYGVYQLKLQDFLDKNVFVEDEKIGQIKDVYFDAEKWQITHLEIQLTKEAAYEVLGAKTATRNSLALSALKEGSACCVDDRVDIKISKAQLHIYLRPVK